MKTSMCARADERMNALTRTRTVYIYIYIYMCVYVCGWQTMMVFYVVKIVRMIWNAHHCHLKQHIFRLTVTLTDDGDDDNNNENEKYSNQPRREHTPSTLDILNKQNKSAPVIMGVIETKKKNEN